MKIPQSGLRLDNPAWPLLKAFISYSGITSGAGAASGLTLVCADLVNEPSYDGLLCKMLSGDAAGQVKPIYVQAGNTLTFATPWRNAAGVVVQIAAGTLFDILSISGGGGGPTPAPQDGLSYYGVVDDVPGANQFTIGSLAGLGAGKFADATNPYVVFILRDAGGAGAAPQGELQAVTTYATATGVFTTAAFSAAVAVGDEILLLNPAVAATLTGITIGGYPDGIVYFNDTDGGAGVAWPVGTADNPSNDEASTLTILTTYGLRKISVYAAAASFVISGAMVGYEFIGHGQYSAMDTIDLNGQDISTSVFHWLNISGAMGGAGLATFHNCVFLATNINGMLKQCLIQTMSLMAGATLDGYDCGAFQGAATITLGTPNPLNLYGWKGGLILDAQTGGTTNIYALGGTITINVTCNGGTINIYGHAIVVDNSAGGCTVNDYTINMAPAADAVTNVQLRDVSGNKTDTALYAVAADASLMRYIKALIGSGIAVQGAVNDAGPAITDFDTDLAEATDNHYNGMLLMFLDGPNVGQAHIIDDYGGVAKNVSFLAGDQWTDVPVNGNSFVILPNLGSLLRALHAVPGADAATNVFMRDVIGNKTDTALAAPTAADSMMRYIKGLLTMQARQIFCMDFWSTPADGMVLTTVAGDVPLPDVVVSGLPAGTTVVRAVCMFKFWKIGDSSGGINYISGAQEIQVRDDTPSAWIDAINFINEQYYLIANQVVGGDVVIGAIDVSGTVDGNDTYNFQWDNGLAFANTIDIDTIQVGIRIWYSI